MKDKAKVLSAYEFMQKFSTEEKAIEFFEKERWPNGVICPFCKSKRIAKRNFPYHRCKDCRDIFTVRSRSVFERSKIKMRKWLYTIYLLQTSRKGISSLQLSKQIGTRQATAWFMLHRLREACKETGGMLSGEVQSDESYFGGEAKNKHAKDKPKKSGLTDKTMVQGIRQENKTKFFIIKSAGKKELQDNIIKSVEKDSHIMTDEYHGYKGLDKHFEHSTVKHSSGEYYDPLTGATTNAVESVWALMKRGHKGVYHQWSKKHLHRYINEFSFRLDKGNCKIDTMDRVKSLMKGAVYKRLTYQKLIS